MPDKHPPGITVQKFTKEQKDAGLVPGVARPDKAVETVILQPNPPSVPPPGPDSGAVEVSEPADISESAPPTSENVPQAGSETPGDVSIGQNEVMIRGQAAIELAKMLGLNEVWNIQTGEPLNIQVAQLNPHLAVIDFASLRESIEDYDPDALTDMVASLPTRAVTAQPAPPAQQRPAPAYTVPAGPTVSVKQYPGLIRVEVDGPVTLRKAKEGNVRILQVSYQTVQAPTSAGRAQRSVAGPSAVRPGQAHQVSIRNQRPTRTVPRQTVEPPVDDFTEESEF